MKTLFKVNRLGGWIIPPDTRLDSNTVPPYSEVGRRCSFHGCTIGHSCSFQDCRFYWCSMKECTTDHCKMYRCNINNSKSDSCKMYNCKIEGDSDLDKCIFLLWCHFSFTCNVTHCKKGII